MSAVVAGFGSERHEGHVEPGAGSRQLARRILGKPKIMNVEIDGDVGSSGG
jgi:hypothetical protein